MKEAAARAIASVIPDEDLTAEYVLPDGFNPEVVKRVSAAVIKAAEEDKVTEFKQWMKENEVSSVGINFDEGIKFGYLSDLFAEKELYGKKRNN